jgi:hypothetical protein
MGCLGPKEEDYEQITGSIFHARRTGNDSLALTPDRVECLGHKQPDAVQP